jgi:hypothetical protein
MEIAQPTKHLLIGLADDRIGFPSPDLDKSTAMRAIPLGVDPVGLVGPCLRTTLAQDLYSSGFRIDERSWRIDAKRTRISGSIGSEALN